METKSMYEQRFCGNAPGMQTQRTAISSIQSLGVGGSKVYSLRALDRLVPSERINSRM